MIRGEIRVRDDGYAAASRNLLAQGKDELAKGDLVQASEKLWGAAAQMVKAVAGRRGGRHDDHRWLFEVVDRLADETGDQDLKTLFHVANSLHMNFYENWHPRGFVEEGARKIEEFLQKVERL